MKPTSLPPLALALLVCACSSAGDSGPPDASVNPGDDGAVTRPDAGEPLRGVTIVDGELRVGGAPFFIQGVGWNPVIQGGVHPRDLDFAGTVDQDSRMMAEAGLNVVRTYSTITDRAVLDALFARGIYVLNTVYAYGDADAAAAGIRDDVEAVADHPALLMWLIGNEWNYNGLYVGMSHADALADLNQVAAIIREIDAVVPIATVYGELPSSDTIEAMPLVDVWGINAYRGITFGTLFDDWATRSDKPMFLAEFGADAWNANAGAEDQQAQAEATVALTGEIAAHRTSAGGPCLGGAIFEWADEWWKDGAGSPADHDVGGIAPGGGPHPDATFNEEWWGIVEIDRTPREAYRALPHNW